MHMTRDHDTSMALDDLLIAWHRWAKSYAPVQEISTSPMFRGMKSPRGWDTLDQIADETIETGKLETVDAVIMQLCDDYRTALQIQARNLCTGRNVWVSTRLPADPDNRAVVLRDARDALHNKLTDLWGKI